MERPHVQVVLQNAYMLVAIQNGEGTERECKGRDGVSYRREAWKNSGQMSSLMLQLVVSSSHFDHSGQAMAQSEPRSWQLSLLAPP